MGGGSRPGASREEEVVRISVSCKYFVVEQDVNAGKMVGNDR